MSKTLEPKQVDRRLASRFILNGQLDEANYQKHLKSLPDLADKATSVETIMDEDFSDDSED